VKEPKFALAALAVMVLSAVAFFALGYRKPVPLVGMAAAVSSLASLAALVATSRAARSLKGGLGAWLLHAGLALVLLGVSFSGPYQHVSEMVVAPGQSFELDGYTLTYKGVEFFKEKGFSGTKATLDVTKGGKSLGQLTPERRIYDKFPQPFSEVSVIPSLGDELYATLLASAQDQSASIKVSTNPLVNWFWIGGALMCLAGLACIPRGQGRAD